MAVVQKNSYYHMNLLQTHYSSALTPAFSKSGQKLKQLKISSCTDMILCA